MEWLRQEQKYLLSLSTFHQLTARLRLLLPQDPNSGPDGYLVRSLYFDTPYNTDYWQKDDGAEHRRKLRLRLYPPATNAVQLELKEKQGEWQRKRTLFLSAFQAEQIARADYSSLTALRDPLAHELFTLLQLGCYRPRALIQYHRIAFLASGARITLDSDIRASESALDLFAPPSVVPIFDPFLQVLEVKFSGFLPDYLSAMLEGAVSSRISVGKYFLGRTVGQHYII